MLGVYPFNYVQRTEWNVRDSDGTVIFSIRRELRGGPLKTAEFAEKHGKPCLHLSKGANPSDSAKLLCDFIRCHQIKILNVAGPRSSKEPNVSGFVMETLENAIEHV
jgi:hypothetical protein